jgi:hypothetical protein
MNMLISKIIIFFFNNDEVVHTDRRAGEVHKLLK